MQHPARGWRSAIRRYRERHRWRTLKGLRASLVHPVFTYFRVPLAWSELVRRTVADTLEDDCPGLAAQLSFYFFLSVFPALLFLVSLLGYVPIETRIGAAVAQLEGFLPPEILQFLRGQIDEALAGRQSGLLTIGILGAIWSSSSAVTAIITALNRAYDIEEWRPWWKRRLTAMALTVALALFVVAAFVFVVGGGELAAWVAGRLGLAGWLARIWTIAHWTAALVLVVLAVDIVYFFAPNARTQFAWVTPGALLATALWLFASLGFKWYVQNFSNYTAVHGAIGAVIVLLLWFYLSSLALLVGAELNAEIDQARRRPVRSGRRGPEGGVNAQRRQPVAIDNGAFSSTSEPRADALKGEA